jgi:heme-degrading monooxygenase HmoA
MVRLYVTSVVKPPAATALKSMVCSPADSSQMGEFITLWRDRVLPALQQEPGFRHAVVLTEPNTDKVVVMALWETETEARASEAGFVQHRLPMVAHLLSGTPTAEGYNVSIHV